VITVTGASGAVGRVVGKAEVAAIVPNWNTREYLEPCIASVAAERGISIEMVVVDNGSRDGSVAFLGHAGVRYHAEPENRGFSWAVNYGVRCTDAPLLLVLNADVVLQAGCVRTLVAELSRDATLAGVQPKILVSAAGRRPGVIYSAGQGLMTTSHAYEIGAGRPDGAVYSQAREVFGVCGAVCLVRREAFDEIGGFDERYFAFYEDVDFNARARLAGWRFYYVPEAVALHHGRAAWSKHEAPQSFNARLGIQNRFATAIKVLPARYMPSATLALARALIASPFRGAFTASVGGLVSLFVRLPGLMRERRRLRAQAADRLDDWLTHGRIT
jgi:GT2 family glycosyltransferase